jgi:hypothetical protein
MLLSVRKRSHKTDHAIQFGETSGLEIHHERAFAKGGASVAENLSLRCRAHNDLAAEADFGREHMQGKKALRPLPE